MHDIPTWWVQDRGYATPCWMKPGVAPGYYAKRGFELLHRVLWVEENGPVPEGMELDHLCRQPGCVRPDHLEPVTHAINIRRGAGAKITAEIAEQIRDETGTLRAIGAKYGLHHTTVLAIRRKQAWV